ncbi:hypothetical protein QDW19_gp61 [Microbacterium phage AvGardian]|uniref:hypothetical protein n=1 Tax=Microbacterium phage AvGardian TaxID=2725619 RepID=UPI001462E04A|nr:hypothetical protein QDW19_gp61 [Microbacterium phage AvGardian]QJD49876.1 hypothetical protein SEA_AVGARDIAN_61 [Microbacterium phage AvGardian]
MASTHPAVKALRKAVDAARGPAEGTVVRFIRIVAGEYDPMRDTNVVVRKQRLTYAALFVNGRWYLTGSIAEGRASSGPVRTNSMTHRNFVELLGNEDVEDAEVAVAWDEV